MANENRAAIAHTCGTCVHWAKKKGEQYGKCRKSREWVAATHGAMPESVEITTYLMRPADGEQCPVHHPLDL